MFVKIYGIEYSNSFRIHSPEAGIKRWLKLSLFLLFGNLTENGINIPSFGNPQFGIRFSLENI